MDRVFKTIALTIVGCGLLAAYDLDDRRLARDEVRAVVCAELDRDRSSADAVRATLRAQPGLAARLEALRRRTLASIRDARFGEDAFQETLLKTWKGRPEMFLKGDDELLRYLRTATRRNVMTLAKRSSPARTRTQSDDPVLDAVADVRETNALDAVAGSDLLSRLTERLGAREREVLAARLRGATSDRQVAAASGISRYAAGQATARIRRELTRLLAERSESVA